MIKHILVIIICTISISKCYTQKYEYNNREYDSLLRKGEYFEIVDTIYSKKFYLYEFTIKNHVFEVACAKKLKSRDCDIIKESLMKDSTNLQSISNKIGKQLFWFASTNIFLYSFFKNYYKKPCVPTDYSSFKMNRESKFPTVKIYCSRYIIVRVRNTNLAKEGLYLPKDPIGQNILITWSNGLEVNYCNH